MNHEPFSKTYHFIHVGRNVAHDEHAKRPIYYVFNNRSDEAIGRIFYYPAWRQWVVSFAEVSVWSTGCLADVQDAIRLITARHAAPIDAPLFSEAAP